MSDLPDLTEEILAFRDERDWAQFHTPRNLAAALSIEAAELQEAMLWKTDPEVAELVASKTGHARLSDEIADVDLRAALLTRRASTPLVRFGSSWRRTRRSTPSQRSIRTSEGIRDADGDAIGKAVLEAAELQGSGRRTRRSLSWSLPRLGTLG